jgi:hypothetical protein
VSFQQIWKVGKVGKVGCESTGCQLAARFYISLNKMVKKEMNNFVVKILKKFDLDTDMFIFIQIISFLQANKVLTRQKILPGDSKNSTVDRQSQLIPCGHD